MIDLSYVAPPVDRELIKKELKQKHFLRKTNKGNKEIYITTAHLSPNIMREIGRLREISFGSEGGGSGKEVDIDEYDIMPDPYCCKQLFVWSPEDEEIVGAYRFNHGSNIMLRGDGTYACAMAEMYNFSDTFVKEYLPYTIELGRAFVQPAYQPSNNLGKGLYSLDNLWDGLGVLACEVPETRYFFGKITMYTDFNTEARDMIMYFYQKHFPDRDGLVWPYDPICIQTDYNKLVKLFTGRNYKEDYQILLHAVRELKCTVPAMINAYMNLSSTMRSFGTCADKGLPGTTDTGILVTITDILPQKRIRYIESYIEKNPIFDRKRLFSINMHRLPWWHKNDQKETSSLEELRQMKELQHERERLRERSRELELELRNIKRRRHNKRKPNT